MDETAAAQAMEDEGRATPQLQERVSRLCAGGGTSIRAEDYSDCPAGRDIQERLRLIIQNHQSEGRPATFAAMAKRELDAALVAAKC
jgi:hypothetical protein